MQQSVVSVMDGKLVGCGLLCFYFGDSNGESMYLLAANKAFFVLCFLFPYGFYGMRRSGIIVVIIIIFRSSRIIFSSYSFAKSNFRQNFGLKFDDRVRFREDISRSSSSSSLGLFEFQIPFLAERVE